MLTTFGLELMEEAVYRELSASPPPAAEEIADRLAAAPVWSVNASTGCSNSAWSVLPSRCPTDSRRWTRS